MEMGGVMIIVMGVMMLAMMGGIAWGAVKTFGSRIRGKKGDAAKTPPRQTLDDRYARGELTTEEYEERRRALERDSG
jgi:putative membrane protein